MNRSDLYDMAFDNLTDTYMALGKAAGNGAIFDNEGLQGFVSAFPHPISNFAVVKQLTPEIAADLQSIVSTRLAFHVYIGAYSNLRRACSLLRKNGFRNTHTLFVMAARPGEDVGGLPLERAESGQVRIDIADFMMSQFPSSYPEWIRQEVMRATAEADGLDLYSYEVHRERIGAIMLRRNDSCVGLYNLCVVEPQRSQGIGTMLVRMTQRVANRQKQPVILQCDRRLVSWYEHLGFQCVGKVEVFVSSQKRW
jgi:GNAT superfamily N-acetyltransferase